MLFLPPIVDAAESSPAAAAESARIIRKYMAKDYSSRPSWQYNAIMLMRILAEHPGETFTRNLDAKFVDAARALLKGTKDNNVRQILMDTLEEFERAKFYDTNLTLIISMWQEEKDKAVEKHGVRDDGHFHLLLFSCDCYCYCFHLLALPPLALASFPVTLAAPIPCLFHLCNQRLPLSSMAILNHSLT